MADNPFQTAAMREFAGCELSPLDAPAFFNRLIKRIQAGERSLLVGHHNLHSLYLFHRDPQVNDFYRRCDDCYVDGLGVLCLLRSAGLDIRSAQRFSLMDCLPEVLDMAQRKSLRVFYLGGSPVAVERASGWVRDRWPALEVELHHGYLHDRSDLVDRINEFAPDLLFVGMGMPIQESWILEHRPLLTAGAILQAGGTLDYYTGLQARPPRRWSRLGLAWFYRLLHDPRRLWRRYLVTPWSLLPPAWRLRRALNMRRG